MFVNLLEVEDHISGCNKNTVIIVDDDEAVRDSLSVLLSLSGFDVRACKSGYEVPEVLKQFQTDCLIIDVHMPDMNGLELVASLKSRGFEMPVVLISGNIDDATRALAMRAGISQVLEKPFSDESLIRAIRSLRNLNATR